MIFKNSYFVEDFFAEATLASTYQLINKSL